MNNTVNIAKSAIAGLVGVVTTATALLGCESLSAQEHLTPAEIYIGLWQGVDEVDGGHSIRSIVPDGSGFKVIGRDTWHGPCGYGDPAVGISRVQVEQESLQGTLELDCQAGETAESGDRSFSVRYTYDAATQTLTETFLDPETGEPLGRPSIIFFRISQ
ncbi:MAG: hypothetical protein ACTS2F_19790 [Thainema sp.]